MKQNYNSKFISFVCESDALKAQDVLSLKGVTSYLKSEFSLYMDGTNVSYDLYIPVHKKDDALKILISSKKTKSIVEIKKIYENSCCRCSSMLVEKEDLSLILLMVSFFTLGLIYMAKSNSCICQNCGFSWKDKYSRQKIFNLLAWIILNVAFWVIIISWLKENI